MGSWRLSISTILYCLSANLLALSTAHSAPIEFTQATTISATNFSHDGQDITVNAATLIIDGSHQFNSIKLINGATLTHSTSPATPLIISSSTYFLIDADSSINITGKGVLPTAAVTGASGGSYGGLGGTYLGVTNPVFGSETQPVDFGVGGIGSGGTTRGGGSIKIIADTLTLNGQINASGEDFITFFNAQGGGSGGSVWLDIGTLSGTGTIQTNGGSGFTFQGGGGGGGGRVSVYYDTINFDLQNNIINEGGVCKPLFGEPGHAGTIYTELKTITPAVNLSPVANAGVSLVVDEQTAVVLQGSATDADGVIASYSWTQLSGPTVTLINSNTAAPDFTSPTVLTADSPGVLSFRLTVTDDEGATASSETSVGVLAVNALPSANAGSDISTNEVSNVTLSGSGSDSDGNITAYQWIQTSGSTVTLNTTAETANFISPRLKTSETLAFHLTVTDNETGSTSDEVLVTVNPVNTLPVAVITPPGSVAETTIIVIDGSASNDPDVDGTIVSYNWTQTAGPNVTLNNTTDSSTSFITPAVYENTVLSFRLDILDDEGGVATSATSVTIYSVNPDDDIDSMLDLWEIQFFGTLDNDGSLDSDNDGASDLQEHDYGTDPTVEQQPAQPEILSPDDVEVSTLQPLLTLTNPAQHPGFSITYQYELYSDAAMSDIVNTTTVTGLSWTVNMALSDNTHYYWRARAVGATLYSEWVSSQFFVNTANDAPGAFNISYPQNGIWVSSFLPTLSVTNSVDVDEDALSYSFEIFIDGDLTQSPFTSIEGILPDESGTSSWTVNIPLQENNWYSWRATVTDEHGLSTVSDTAMVFVNTVNDAPTTPTLFAPLDNSEITTLYTDLMVNNASDPEAEPIQYIFELDTTNTFDSANKQSSGSVSEASNVTSWSATALLDNTLYHWRAKASDGFAESPWVNGSFFVNQFNDAPTAPKAFNPGDNAWVGSLQPTLEAYPAIDIDGDNLSYEFEIYTADKNGENHQLIITGSSNSTSWQLDTPLVENGYYYWQARAIDEHGLAGEWGQRVMFFADSDGINDTPVIKLKPLKYEHGDVFTIHSYENENRYSNGMYGHRDHGNRYGHHGNDEHHSDRNRDGDRDRDEHRNDSEHRCNRHESDNDNDNDESFVEIKWKDHDSDSNARISLYYDTDRNDENGIAIVHNLLEDPDGKSDRFLWNISEIPPGIYYVYAIIDDGNSSSVEYSKNAVVIGNGGGLPFLILKSPDIDNKGKRTQRAKIEWSDMDYNSNASISLYHDTDNTGFDGTLITDTIKEDPDGYADKYTWDVSALPGGEYFIYAVISDEANSYHVYANESFLIKHHEHHDSRGNNDNHDNHRHDDSRANNNSHNNYGHDDRRDNDDSHDNNGHHEH